MADYTNAIRQAAQRFKIRPELLLAQLKQESGFNPNAKNPKSGATGIAQIMPATAKGWHVNPTDPIASINAAAKHMGEYIKQYGGSESKALAAYNAGPGTAASGHYPAETTKYISAILGSAGKGSGGPAVGPAASPGKAQMSSYTAGKPGKPGIPGVDNSATRLALTQQFLSSKDPNPLTYAVGIKGATDTPATPGTPGTPGKFSAAGSQDAAVSGTPGNSARGANLPPDPKNPVPPQLIEIGKMAQGMGLHVGENPAFGGVNPVHVTNSWHYRNEALDVSGDPAKMLQFNHEMAARHGSQLKELFYNGAGGKNIKNGKPEPLGFVSGHTDHVHIAM